MRDKYPAYYRGLQGGKVVIDTIMTSEVSEGRRPIVKREYISPQVFQEELNSGLYEKTKHFGEKALNAYLDLVKLITKNKDSYLDLAKAFHKTIGDIIPDEETNSLELYNMKWRDEERKDTRSTKQMKRGSTNQELTDWLMNDLLGESVLYGSFDK